MAADPLTQAVTLRDNYLQALVDDSASPQPTYSLDGESVSREAWRDNLLKLVKEMNELIQIYQPFELRSQVL